MAVDFGHDESAELLNDRAKRLKWAKFYAQRAEAVARSAAASLERIAMGEGTVVDRWQVARAVRGLRLAADRIEVRTLKGESR